MAKKKKAKRQPEQEAAAPEPEQEAAAPEPEQEAAATEPEPEQSEEERPEWPENGYKVADGHSVCCGAKIMGAKSAIEPSDLHDNDEVALQNFDRLLDCGAIVEA